MAKNLRRAVSLVSVFWGILDTSFCILAVFSGTLHCVSFCILPIVVQQNSDQYWDTKEVSNPSTGRLARIERLGEAVSNTLVKDQESIHIRWLNSRCTR